MEEGFWEDQDQDFRTCSCLLLTIRGWRGLSGDKDNGGELLKRPGPEAACRTIEEL